MLQRESAGQRAGRVPALPLETIAHRVCAALAITPTALQAGSRRAVVCRAWDGIAYLGVEVMHYPAPRLASVLGGRPPSDHRPAQRDRAAREQWDCVLSKEKN